MKDAVITLPAYSAIICYLQNSKLLVNLSFFKQDCTFSVKVFHTSLGSISIIVCEFQFFFKGQSCLGSVLGKYSTEISSESVSFERVLRSLFPLRILQVNVWYSFHCSFLRL